jgi:hypothetical protein
LVNALQTNIVRQLFYSWIAYSSFSSTQTLTTLNLVLNQISDEKAEYLENTLANVKERIQFYK